MKLKEYTKTYCKGRPVKIMNNIECPNCNKKHHREKYIKTRKNNINGVKCPSCGFNF